MANIDDLDTIKRFDSNSMITNIDELADQVEDAWNKVYELAIPSHYIKHSNILITGPGSSVVAGDIVADLIAPTAKVPVIVHRASNLPEFVDAKTLVIASSYSGSNKETVNVFEQAAKRGAKLMVVSSGGSLESLTRKYPSAFYKIVYGAKSRAAIGYFFTALLGIMTRLGHIEVTNDQIEQTISLLHHGQQKLRPSSDTANNLAKQLAAKVDDKIPFIIGSGNLRSVARRYKQQINLNAKSLSIFDELPEASHNTLLGFELPKDLSSEIFIISLQSAFADKMERGFEQALFEVLERQRIDYDSVLIPTDGNVIAEVLAQIQLCDYFSYYLALLRDKDPERSLIAEFIQDRLQQIV